MKNTVRWFSLFSLLLVAVACHTNSGIQTEVCKKDKVFAFAEGSEENLSLKMKVEYVTDGLKKEIKDAVNQVIVGTAFGNEYVGLTVSEAADVYAQDIYKNYKESNESYLDEVEKMEREEMELDEINRATFNWQMNLDASFLPPYEHYLNYLVETYSFEGGAHGMSYKIPVVLDSKTGKIVQEEDLFMEGYREKLSQRLTEHLHDSFENEEDYECLFTKDIEPNDCFYLTSKGVVYIYGAYDIGPYYLGIIEVTVPWEELEEILK